tara:strand:- start:71 stop:757 length:687 start_codon:yes stop_codon:yes gene_type:complete
MNKIKWYFNFPILSWIILRAKCNHCSNKISAKYPLVELLTGVSFIIFSSANPYFYFFNLNNPFEKIFSWAILSILLAVSFIDFEHFWIPQGLIKFGSFMGILNLIVIEFYKIEYYQENVFLKGIIGAASAYLFFELLRISSKYVFKKDALGKGDSKLVAMLGIWLGPIGILLGIGISYVIASIYLLIGIKIKKIRKGQLIPFAPFLSAGGLVVWYFGNETLIRVIYRQ